MNRLAASADGTDRLAVGHLGREPGGVDVGVDVGQQAPSPRVGLGGRHGEVGGEVNALPVDSGAAAGQPDADVLKCSQVEVRGVGASDELQ